MPLENNNGNDGSMSFWEHLDVLRTAIIKIVTVTLICGIVAFVFKESLFRMVLAPKYDDFVTYRWLFQLSELLGADLM